MENEIIQLKNDVFNLYERIEVLEADRKYFRELTLEAFSIIESIKENRPNSLTLGKAAREWITKYKKDICNMGLQTPGRLVPTDKAQVVF